MPLCDGFASVLAALRKSSGPWKPVQGPARTTGSTGQVLIKHHPNVPLQGIFLYAAFLHTHPQSGHGTFLTARTSASSEPWCQRLPSSFIPKKGAGGGWEGRLLQSLSVRHHSGAKHPRCCPSTGQSQKQDLSAKKIFLGCRRKNPSPSSKPCPSEVSSKTLSLPPPQLPYRHQSLQQLPN